jgi:hypothetical protein
MRGKYLNVFGEYVERSYASMEKTQSPLYTFIIGKAKNHFPLILSLPSSQNGKVMV